MKRISQKSIRNLFIFTFLLFIPIGSLIAQVSGSPYCFYVQLADKNNSPYSISKPSDYLSPRAIARRAAFGISCDVTDLPVNSSYILGIENLGAHVHCASKWMNGLVVILSDSSKMSEVRKLSFVRFVEYTGRYDVTLPAMAPKPLKTNALATDLNYGLANDQINQLNGKYLHDRGFRGAGIFIGVMDGGFKSVNKNAAFDAMRSQGRFLGTKDIVNPYSNSNVFNEDLHGAKVLSAMAGNYFEDWRTNKYIGTAPDASYFLIRTEYSPTENKVEIDFWCRGIEFADSLGIDVINSSLGYTEFDDQKMNFTRASMNGEVSRCSRAATIASQKGIIVVVAAGNDGNKPWHLICSPGDAKDIVTVGAVAVNGTSALFSSYGPTSDGRVKPEICARGSQTALIDPSGNPTPLTYLSDGTSYASPIMAGMMACYLQAAKQSTQLLSIQRIQQNVFESGDLYTAPTGQRGYGIPNFETAVQKLSVSAGINQPEKSENYKISYDQQKKKLFIWSLESMNMVPLTVRLYSTTGKLILQKNLNNEQNEIDVQNLTSGVYAFSIIDAVRIETKKIMIF